MNTRILILAHAPLAHALRECALHVLADSALHVLALDVQPDAAPHATLAAAQLLLCPEVHHPTLVLTDVLGATPCNVAQRLVAGAPDLRLIAGASLPMLLRAVTYRSQPLDEMAQRALAGGVQGAMPLGGGAPQNQPRRAPNDQERHDHQQ